MYLGPYLGFAGLLPDKRPAPRSFSEVGQITVIRQDHLGAAAARNSGLKESSADILLFLGADIPLRPNALIELLVFH